MDDCCRWQQSRSCFISSHAESVAAGEQRSHAQIDASSDHDRGHANGKDALFCDLTEYVGKIAEVEKDWATSASW